MDAEKTVSGVSPAADEKAADEVLRLALDIAEHILENGGEMSRVENTIERIGYALGAAHVEAFAVTTLITASVRMKDGAYSQQMRRVKNTSVNLYRVEELNRISRELCSGVIDMDAAHSLVDAVAHSHQTKRWLIIIGCAATAAGFRRQLEGCTHFIRYRCSYDADTVRSERRFQCSNANGSALFSRRRSSDPFCARGIRM